MKKGLEIFLNIIKTLIALPIGIIGIVLLLPFVAINFIVSVLSAIISTIWDLETFSEESLIKYKTDNQE